MGRLALQELPVFDHQPVDRAQRVLEASDLLLRNCADTIPYLNSLGEI